MIIYSYSLSFSIFLILLLWSSNCCAYDHSIKYNNNYDSIELTYDDYQQSTIDEYVDPMKYEKASYKHEQNLLANIYSPTRTYISVHDDRIHPSNFSYFTFNSFGTYRFILISTYGDADLYISTNYRHVTYDNYEYSSCTCGIDEILIDPFMKRPIYIGIYGYSQYQVSYYRLLIEIIDSKKSQDETTFQSIENDQSYSDSNERQTSQINPQSSSVVVENNDEEQHLLWNIFLWILNFLVEVLT